MSEQESTMAQNDNNLAPGDVVEGLEASELSSEPKTFDTAGLLPHEEIGSRIPKKPTSMIQASTTAPCSSNQSLLLQVSSDFISGPQLFGLPFLVREEHMHNPLIVKATSL